MCNDERLLLGVSLGRLRHHEFFHEEFEEPSVLELVPLLPEVDKYLVEVVHLAAPIVGRALGGDEFVLATDRIVQGVGLLLVLQDLEKYLAGGGDSGPAIVHLLSQARGWHFCGVLVRILGKSQKNGQELDGLIELQRNQSDFNDSRLGRGGDEVTLRSSGKIAMKIDARRGGKDGKCWGELEVKIKD